jgi:hypothetical protein
MPVDLSPSNSSGLEQKNNYRVLIGTSCAASPTILMNENAVLARLMPLDRWKYLAKHNRGELIIWLIALFVGAYMVISAAIHLGISIFSSAVAQTLTGALTSSSHDAFDWYVGFLMGICLLVSLGMAAFSQTESKISFGKDSSRTIIGFVVGFLSGTKAR